MLLGQGQIGIKVGPSFGNITNEGLLPSNLRTRTGAAGGVYLGTGSGVLGFGLEALYAQRGAISTQSFATADTRLDYIDVPVYLRVGIPSPGFRPYLYAGPQVSFEIQCRMANGAACASPSDRKRTDYAAVLGGGVRFGGHGVGLSVEGRYAYGLTDLSLGTVSNGASYRSRTFMLLVGIGR
jgi:hypothetical protein